MSPALYDHGAGVSPSFSFLFSSLLFATHFGVWCLRHLLVFLERRGLAPSRCDRDVFLLFYSYDDNLTTATTTNSLGKEEKNHHHQDQQLEKEERKKKKRGEGMNKNRQLLETT
jgi:hypothetical protein